MASKMQNVAGIFKNVKSRTIFIVTVIIIIIGLLIAINGLRGTDDTTGGGGASLPLAPGIGNNPDVLGQKTVSQQRARLTKIADDTAVWNAARRGESALPTAMGQKVDPNSLSAQGAQGYNQHPLTDAEKQLDALVYGASQGGRNATGGAQGAGDGQGIGGGQGVGGGQGAGGTQGTDGTQGSNLPGQLTYNQKIFQATQRQEAENEAQYNREQAQLNEQIYTDDGSYGDSNEGGNPFTAPIGAEVKQLLSSWNPVSQQYVETGFGSQDTGSSADESSSGRGATVAALAKGGQQQGTTNQSANATAPPLIKAGSVVFAVLQTAVNTDEPGPIMATIETGKFRGGKLLGSIQKNGKYAKGAGLKFTMMTLPQYNSSLSISAFAIDPDTARTALASDVDHHYMLRYGTLFASSFLGGLSDALEVSGNTTVTPSTGGSTSFHDEFSSKETALYALGNAGNEFSDKVDFSDRPTTIQIYAGTGIGVLFMQDLAAPSTKQQ